MFKYGILIMGLAGFILFFPYKFGNNHSCLAHKYLKSNLPECCLKQNISDHADHSIETDINPVANHHLLSHYIFPFAFLWWASIGLLVIQIRNIKNKHKRLKMRNQGLTR